MSGSRKPSSVQRLQNITVSKHSPAPFDSQKKEGKELAKSTTLLSRITTIKFDDSQIVPKKNRRGLLSSFCMIPEYQDARNLPPSLRRAIVFIIAFCAMLGPMGTSILLPASDDAVADLDTTITILNVAIGVYLITLGVIPLWWSNFSERHGRRSIYIISFIMYLGFTIGCALSNSINTLIGFRILSGGCAASVQSVGAGTIGDLYPITKRGVAMGLFYLGPLAGPLLSPIIGGAITSNKRFGWRATQWFLVCLSGGCCLMIIFFLPETLRKQDNREAIRQILRERRRNRIPKADEETAGEKCAKKLVPPVVDDPLNDPKRDVNSANQQNIPHNSNINPSGLPLSPVGSIDSEAISDDDMVSEEEVEHLNKLLTRMSTHQSFAGGGIKKEGSNRSRKPSVASTRKTRPSIDGPQTAELVRINRIERSGKFHLAMHYMKIYLYSPLKAFIFIRYPPVFLAMAYSAPCFAALYVQNMTLTYMYSKAPYNFTPILVGLVYIPNSVTYFIASIWGGKFNDYLLKKKIEKYGIVAPEARFGINVYVAAAILPCSLLITGWCLEYGEHWVTPLIGTALFGFAQMIVIGVTVTYLADCLPGKGATGIALNNFIRMIMAAGVSFATEPLIKAIGTGVLFSICAGVTAALSVLLVIIIKRGDHWRETYDLEKLYDLVDS
ncbi:hypothetical protein PICMEDRAFT_56741 [Pichia membranifaciens NRRL Y-2026]|uniref:Major facilitator superfamily (MFS) profile domain-containing protein n=1 Tax=Pichia membranifaciens NRRL Y-2026 TaxID=763406 RepID=A0A1E3NQZ0_9ASCO|nr:hypothetical protein PICMEDRAFT_56741 [Pichia membranifaciens NRRL Y-2026]ODQ48485.1 hypothetical protein PICMEDRAFT_56741 [Pichia membranifaciens NRRL Y-2026]